MTEDYTASRIMSLGEDSEVDAEIERLRMDQHREELLGEIREKFQSGGVVFVLGAGVSVSCDLPSWNELLLRLHTKSLSDSRGSLDLVDFSKLYWEAVKEESPIISARLAAQDDKEVESSEEGFRNSIREALYGDEEPKPSKLALTIAKLTNRTEGIEGVRSVMTYNFDMIIERAMDQIGRRYYHATRGGQDPQPGICIRHLHGFLGWEEVSHEWVILSEDHYHNEYNDPYTWSNISQLNAFRENTCIFIGLSMTDPNMRRLLEAAKKTASRKHYAFLRRTDPSPIYTKLGVRWETTGRPTGENSSRVLKRVNLATLLADSSRSAALDQLGVKVVWYDQHSELPVLLPQIAPK